MNKSLLDTDIYSEVLKAVDTNVNQNAVIYRKQHGFYTVSVVTLMEIVQGFQRTRSVRRLETFLSAVAQEEVLIFDEADAELAGRIVGDLDRSGTPIGVADPMIAAIAINQDLELITGNSSHFEHIRKRGYTLKIANWRK